MVKLIREPKKEKVMEQLEKKFYISVLNVVSCFSVIMLHCNGIYWTFPEGRLLISSSFIETFFYFAVPIFFMNTGATCIDYSERYDTKTFLKRRFGKTLFPFVFWSFVWIIIECLISKNSTSTFRESLNQILMTNTSYGSVYWFFPCLFAVYLSIPVFSAIEKNKRLVFMEYVSIIGIIFVSLLPLLFKLVGLRWNGSFTPSIVAGYLMYPAIGYVLSKMDFPKKYRLFIYFAGALGWLLHFIGGIILSLNVGYIDKTFKEYLNFPTVLQSIAVFVLFKTIFSNANYFLCNNYIVKKCINNISQCTFGIYLIHNFYVATIPRLGGFSTASIVWRTVGSIIVFVLSYIIVKVLKKIPILRYIV